MSSKNKNISVVAVLGIYHSSLVGGYSNYAFVNPESDDLLFDNFESWDSEFKLIWEKAKLKWVEKIRMDNLGLWRNTLKRAGQEGAGILKEFPSKVATNTNGAFPPKLDTEPYASSIVKRMYWPEL